MALFPNIMMMWFVLHLPVQSADNSTANFTKTTGAVESTQFVTTTESELLLKVQSTISSFHAELQDSFCSGGLGVGGPKCSDDLYGLQEFIDSFEEYMNVDSINASEEVSDIADVLNDKLSVRSVILYNLSDTISTSCYLYAADYLSSEDLPDYDALYFSGTNEIAATLPSDTEWSDIYNKNVSFSASTFRIPHNVNYWDSQFKFDAIISSLLDPLFIQLYEEHCAANALLSRAEEACSMYFGSINGMFRQFPGSENPKSASGEYKSYDPRLRPWYISASSSDIDVVILLDLSGSMEDRIDLVIEGILSIFDTLSVLSFVNIIGFNLNLQQTCFEDRLFEATHDSFSYLEEWLLNEIAFVGSSVFEMAFDAAYDLITNHRAIHGNNCNTAILLITDGGDNQNEKQLLQFITQKTSISDMNVDDVQIFTYTIGDDADQDLANSIAELTGGITTHIQDDDAYVSDKMSMFYKYYALTADVNNDVSVSQPYFSFSTGEIQITLSLPLFLNGSFLGVFGIDVPLSILEDAIGDVPIGKKSYSFVMNDNGILLLHPETPDIIDYEDGLYDEFQTISAADIEPKQFIDNGVFQSMLNREYGFTPMTISYLQSAGDEQYNGYIEVDTDVIYFYSPIGPSSLSFAVVVWNDNKYTPPLISGFGLDSANPKACPVHSDIENISELKADEMDGCLASFNLFHDIDLMSQCNDTNLKEWMEEAQIMNINTETTNYENVFSQSDFYNNKNISLQYSTFFLQSGLWEQKSDALKGIDPTCEEFENLQRFTNPLMLSPRSDSIPYGGFKFEFSSHSLASIYVFTSLFNWWKPAFLEPDSKIVSLWFGSYKGRHNFFICYNYA